VAGALWGAIAIASEDPLPPETESRLEAFCELASLGVASAQARADLIASRARLVKAGDEQRRRLERNLHDGAQQRFVSVVLTLRLARDRLATDQATASALLEQVARELDAGLEELREIARGTGNLLPPIREALRDRCSLGEVCGAMQDVFGAYRPSF